MKKVIVAADQTTSTRKSRRLTIGQIVLTIAHLTIRAPVTD
jgi:hypothetical protein